METANKSLIIKCFYWRYRKSEEFRIQSLWMSKNFDIPQFIEGE